jgi:hypothetical protein
VVGRGEFDVADALVARHTVFAADVGPAGIELALLVQHGLQVVFFLHPAGGTDGVAVGADQHLVVVAHAPLAPRQRTPGVAAQPSRETRRVLPAARAGVAR